MAGYVGRGFGKGIGALLQMRRKKLMNNNWDINKVTDGQIHRNEVNKGYQRDAYARARDKGVAYNNRMLKEYYDDLAAGVDRSEQIGPRPLFNRSKYGAAGAAGIVGLGASEDAEAGINRVIRELMIRLQRKKDTYAARFSDQGNSIPARRLMKEIDEDEAKLARLQKQLRQSQTVAPDAQSATDEAAYLREMIRRRTEPQAVDDVLEGQIHDQMEMFPRSPYPVRYP